MPALTRKRPARTVVPVRNLNGIRALTASAARVNLNDRQSIRRFVSTRQGWQEEAWHYRREIGELRYATAYLGNSAMRMRLFPAAYLPGGAVPQDATHVPGVPPDLVQAAADTIARLASGGPFALGQLLKKQTENFEVAGECYLVGTIDAFGIENWNVYSTSEMVFDTGGRLGIRIIPGSGMSADDVQWLSSANSYATRLWWPDPQFGAMADSPVRAALGICYELQLLSLDVRATAKSRLANNGILKVPEGLSIVGPNPADETTLEGDPFMATLVQAATAALSDEGSAAAILPLLIRGHPDALKELTHMPLDRAADKQNADKRKELLGRLATTIDLPSEILTGIADLNHWSAWQVDDNAFRHHIEPVVQVEIDALTAGFLWPMLAAYRRWPQELIRRVCIWYDPTELVTHPDRATDAKTAYDSGAIGRAALREYLGMTSLDKPDDLDEILYVLKNAGHVDPVLLTAILKSLKQTSIQIPDSSQLQSAQVAQSQEELAGAKQDVAEAQAAPGAPGQPPALPPGGETGGPTGPSSTPQAAPPADMTRRVANARANLKLRALAAAATAAAAITAAADPNAPIADSLVKPDEDPEHSGAMVAIYPDEDSANKIALDDPDAEQAANLHVTMCYLPDFDPGQLDELNQAVDQFAAAQQPVSGKLGGIGQFNPSEGSDGKPVTYASVDAPGLTDMRTDLVRHLSDAGFQVADNHGYTPHMTLIYGEKPDLQIPDTPLTFGHLTVTQEPTRTHFPLGTAPSPEALAAAAADYTRDSAKLAQLDRDLRSRLQTVASSTMRRAFERAGAKVITKTKSTAGRQIGLAASIEGLDTWVIPIQVGPSLLAALGIGDLINDDILKELHDAYTKFIETGQDQALRLAAKIAGLDVNAAFGMKQQLREHQQSGWDFLVQTLTIRAHELVQRLSGDNTPMTIETDLVPYGPVRATIAIAGGQPPSAFDTATGLPVDPDTVVGGLGNGIVVSDLIEGAGGHVERYIWHHGWATNPFDPHVRLDGTTFTDFTDERFRAEPLPSGADFPRGGFYHPGDHGGCTCDFEVVWARPEPPMPAPAMVAGAWEEAKHPRNKGKFARKAGPGQAVKLSEALGKRDESPQLDLTSERRPDGQRWGEGYSDPRDPRNDPEYDRRAADLDNRITDVLGTVGDTENLYDKIDGAADVYNPHREALHEKIINKHLSRFARIPRDRQAIMLAGPPGSGKTTVLANNGHEFGVEGFKNGQHGPESSNFAVLNADDIKADLLADGEYPSAYADAGVAPNEASQFLHEESSYLMKELQTRLRHQGTNLIIDGTFGGSDVGQREKALGFQADGYRVTGVLVDGDIGTALEGAGKRHQKGGTFKGRYVPYKLITDQSPRTGGPTESPLTGHSYRSANAQNFDFALDAFDGGAHVFDRHGGETLRTAHTGPK